MFLTTRMLCLLYLVLAISPSAFAKKLYNVHTDHLGTPVYLTDADQRVVWRNSPTPFGISNVQDDPDGDGETIEFNLRFPGQYYDATTGLHYNYYRDYDPTTGRYVQSDPIGLAGGMNTYAYAKQNPLTYRDIYGLRPTKNPTKYGQPIVHGCKQTCVTNFIGMSILATGLGYGLGHLAGTSMGAMSALHTASSVNSAYGYFDLSLCLTKCDEDKSEECN